MMLSHFLINNREHTQNMKLCHLFSTSFQNKQVTCELEIKKARKHVKG